MHSPTPWTLEEMTTSIVIRDARGHTVCNLPLQSDKARRRANADLIVLAVKAIEPQAGSTKAGENWTTRRAPHMERYTEIVPSPSEEHPDAHIVRLKVGNQSFQLSDGVSECHETKEAAEWARDMLCIALDQLQQGKA